MLLRRRHESATFTVTLSSAGASLLVRCHRWSNRRRVSEMISTEQVDLPAELEVIDVERLSAYIRNALVDYADCVRDGIQPPLF